MRPVVIVQHEPSVPPGSIAEVLESLRVAHFVFEAWKPERWPSAEELGALIVMGGTMNVDEVDVYPFLSSSRALVAAAISQGVPTLGVCLGAQMIARVLDGDVTRAESRNAFFSELELTAAGRTDPVMEPFTPNGPVLQFHEDTFVVPDTAVTLATSAASGLPQAFRYGHHTYAVQFHFEVDAEIIRTWMRDIGPRAMVEEWGTSEQEMLHQADRHLGKQEVAGKESVRRFLKIAKGT